MMPIFAVMVSPEGTQRYIDSVWVQESSAETRKEQLVRTMEAGRFNMVRLWVLTLTLEDAKVVENG